MGILSSIGRLIKKLFEKLIDAIVQFIKKYWAVILILAVIWFAPVITAYLTSAGAPNFIVAMFNGLSTITPYLRTAASWLYSGARSVGSAAWTAYRSLDTGMQIGLALGAAAMIAPDETADLITDVAELGTNLLVSASTGVLGALTSNTTLLAIGGGLLVYYLFIAGDDDSKEIVIDNSNGEPGSTLTA